MNSINQVQILNKISEFDLKNNSNLRSLISNIIIKNSNIGFSINISKISRGEAEVTRKLLIQELEKIHNIGKITIALTSDKKDEKKSKIIVDNISKIILISSGKGGVGKSTITSLLAESLVSKNKKVGIMDADIYGPSIPHIFGVKDLSPQIIDKMMIPIIARNIQIMSIGFLVKDKPLAWRGPMVSKAIYQLLSLTKWNDLDYLLIDMPPGTGDIHISILENYVIDSSIIVTTPQEISEIDVKKVIELHKIFKLPNFAIIENMSFFKLPNSNEEIKLFAGQSADKLSSEYNIGVNIKLPFTPDLSTACDKGESLEKFKMLDELVDKLV